MAEQAVAPRNTSADPKDEAALAPDHAADIVALYHRVAEHAPLPISMTAGPAHLLCGANLVFCRLLGVDSAALVGRSPVEAVPASDTERMQHLLDRVYQTGEAVQEVVPQPIELAGDQLSWAYTVWPIRDGQSRSAGLVVMIRDSTAHYRSEQTLIDARAINEHLLLSALREFDLMEQLQQQLALVQALALTDELTGLYNRRGFMTLAAQQLKLARRTHHTLSLIFLDLDGLKRINDSLGHAVGNQAIIIAAQILTDTFRDSDIIARFGGDEFVVLAMDSDAEDPGTVLQRLQAQTVRHMADSNTLFQLSLSMGIAHSTAARPCTLDELLEQADAQMYITKQAKQVLRAVGDPPYHVR
jgi:diguanylate cyclase (GGDEF)-like protein/PAS domain S-box-containing protein